MAENEQTPNIPPLFGSPNLPHIGEMVRGKADTIAPFPLATESTLPPENIPTPEKATTPPTPEDNDPIPNGAVIKNRHFNRVVGEKTGRRIDEFGHDVYVMVNSEGGEYEIPVKDVVNLDVQRTPAPEPQSEGQRVDRVEVADVPGTIIGGHQRADGTHVAHVDIGGGMTVRELAENVRSSITGLAGQVKDVGVVNTVRGRLQEKGILHYGPDMRRPQTQAPSTTEPPTPVTSVTTESVVAPSPISEPPQRVEPNPPWNPAFAGNYGYPLEEPEPPPAEEPVQEPVEFSPPIDPTSRTWNQAYIDQPAYQKKYGEGKVYQGGVDVPPEPTGRVLTPTEVWDQEAPPSTEQPDHILTDEEKQALTQEPQQRRGFLGRVHFPNFPRPSIPRPNLGFLKRERPQSQAEPPAEPAQPESQVQPTNETVVWWNIRSRLDQRDPDRGLEQTSKIFEAAQALVATRQAQGNPISLAEAADIVFANLYPNAEPEITVTPESAGGAEPQPKTDTQLRDLLRTSFANDPNFTEAGLDQIMDQVKAEVQRRGGNTTLEQVLNELGFRT